MSGLGDEGEEGKQDIRDQLGPVHASTVCRELIRHSPSSTPNAVPPAQSTLVPSAVPPDDVVAAGGG